MTTPAERRRNSRRELFATITFRSVDNRVGLVALARAGYAGIRLQGNHVLPSLPDRDLVALIALLRDARGVGLRVSWIGEGGGLDLQPFRHLDPPRQPDGSFAWSLRAHAQLHARRGPKYIAVDDTRDGPRRRTLIDRSAPEAAVLDTVNWGTEISAKQQAGVDGLTAAGLAFAAGSYCLGLPVRQGIWCV